MNTEQMRQWLLAQYPHSSTWPNKVKNMSEAQVFATYQRIKNPKTKKK